MATYHVAGVVVSTDKYPGDSVDYINTIVEAEGYDEALPAAAFQVLGVTLDETGDRPAYFDDEFHDIVFEAVPTGSYLLDIGLELAGIHKQLDEALASFEETNDGEDLFDRIDSINTTLQELADQAKTAELIIAQKETE